MQKLTPDEEIFGSFKGMTVNERLFLSGLMDDFDRAKERHDKERLVEILRKIEVDDPSITKILEDSGVD